MDTVPNTAARVTPWNKGKLLGQKPPHRANAGSGRVLAQGGASETGAVSLSEPRVGVTSSLDQAVFPDRRVLGVDWA